MKKLILLAIVFAPMIMSAQSDSTCVATTKAGTNCKAKVKVMGGLCWRHDPNYVSKTGSVQCSGTKKDGNKCTLKTTHESGRCHHHRAEEK